LDSPNDEFDFSVKQTTVGSLNLPKKLNNYIQAVYDRPSCEVKPLYKHLWGTVVRLYTRYGPDGYGRKPADMDPVDYWLSHLTPYTNLINPHKTPLAWEGAAVCFSGKLVTKRNVSEALVMKAGGTVVKTVTKNTTYVVFGGEFDTKKVRLAIEKNIPIVFEMDFVRSIRDVTLGQSGPGTDVY